LDAGQIALDSSTALIARQLQTTTAMQLAVIKKIAESQQQMAEMLTAIGIGTNIDVSA